MLYTIKSIFILIFLFYIFKSLKNYILNNSDNCKHLYEYSILEKQPNEQEEGRKIYICKYCRNKYYEKIPILN